MRFQKFIRVFFEKKRPMKKYKKLLFITVEYDGRDIRIPMPYAKITRNMTDLNIFKDEVIKFLNKKVIHNLTLDNEGYKSI